MIDLEAIGKRWGADFSGQTDVLGISDTARTSLDTFLATEEKCSALTVVMLTAEARLMLAEIVERRRLHDLAIGDLHDLVKLAAVVRAYGKARIAVSEAFEAWEPTTGVKREKTGDLLNAAHRVREEALDRLEAIAVAMAGGDVRRVCGGPGEDDAAEVCGG